MTCLWCGEHLATSNRRARYCSASCRSRAHRDGPQAVAIVDREPSDGEIVAIVTRQLEALGVIEEDLGRAALVCARAIESPQTSATALVALTRELPDLMRYLRERQSAN